MIDSDAKTAIKIVIITKSQYKKARVTLLPKLKCDLNDVTV